VPAFIGGLAASCILKLVDEHLVSQAIMLGTWVTMHIRVLAVNHELRLPTFPAGAVYSKLARPRDMAADVASEEDREWQMNVDHLRANPFRRSISDPTPDPSPANRTANAQIEAESFSTNFIRGSTQ